MAFQPFTPLPTNNTSSGFKPLTTGNQVSKNPGYVAPKTTPVKSVSQPQQSNPIQGIIGQIYQGAVKVGQMLQPQKPAVKQAPKIIQPIKLPMGLRLDFVNAP